MRGKVIMLSLLLLLSALIECFHLRAGRRTVLMFDKPHRLHARRLTGMFYATTAGAWPWAVWQQNSLKISLRVVTRV